MLFAYVKQSVSLVLPHKVSPFVIFEGL